MLSISCKLDSFNIDNIDLNKNVSLDEKINSPVKQPVSPIKLPIDIFVPHEPQSPLKGNKKVTFYKMGKFNIKNRHSIKYDKIPQNTPLKNEIENSHIQEGSDLIAHAKWRPVMFGLTAFTFYGLALRSNPESKRTISLNVNAAWHQMGIASNGYNAAHINAAAGFVDSLEDGFITEIINDKEISPFKKRLMVAKGFTEDDFEKMKQNNYDLDKVREIFNARWPFIASIPQSILNNTRLIDTLNMTTPLTEHANLVCDKNLEIAMKDKIILLYQQCMTAEKSVEEATKEYSEGIREYFSNKINEINLILPLIVSYKSVLSKVYINYPFICSSGYVDFVFDCEKFKSVLTEISELLNKIMSSPLKIQNNSKKYNFNANKSFVNDVVKFLNGKLSHTYLVNYINKCGERLLDECMAVLNHYTESLREVQSQIEGTTDPDMSHIIGLLEKEYQYDPEDVSQDPSLQFRLLAPKEKRMIDDKVDSQAKKVCMTKPSVRKVLFHED